MNLTQRNRTRFTRDRCLAGLVLFVISLTGGFLMIGRPVVVVVIIDTCCCVGYCLVLLDVSLFG